MLQKLGPYTPCVTDVVVILLFVIFLAQTPNRSNFLVQIITLDVFLTINLIFLNSLIFFDHHHQDLNLATFDPLATPPCSTPPHHPPRYLHKCFLYPKSPKTVLHHQILTEFTIFKVYGWQVIFGYFGVFFPHFDQFVSSLGTIQKLFEVSFLLQYPDTVQKKPAGLPGQSGQNLLLLTASFIYIEMRGRI